MRPITRSSFAIIPIISFALTIILANNVARHGGHQHDLATSQTTSTTDQLHGSYRTMLENLNSISVR